MASSTRKIRHRGSRFGVLWTAALSLVLAAPAFAGCAKNGSDDGDDGGTGVTPDASVKDAAQADTSAHDTSTGEDAGALDDASQSDDAAPSDASDALAPDGGEGGYDAAPDASSSDAGCVPSALACDGLDHKCDGIVDEGCPSAVTFGAPTTDGPLWGNASGGVAFSDPCPAGQVLIGASGHLGSSLDGIGGLCGIASLNEDTTTTPHTYSIAITTGSLLPGHGGTGSTAWTRQCPANQAVVGISGQSGQLIDGITIACASLVVSGSIGAYTIAQGTSNTLNYVGGTGGSVFSPFACPSTQVARIIGGHAGNSLDALSISCGTPAFTLH